MNTRWNSFFKSLLIYFLFAILTICKVQGAIYVDGTYIGTTTWNADTVKVTGDVNVDSLFIRPGTVIEFQGNYRLNVGFHIEAIGAAGDTILFTIKDTTGFSDPETNSGGWGGIFTHLNLENTGAFAYCKLQYAKNSPGAIWNDEESSFESEIKISNSLIVNNYSNGLFVDAGKMSVYRTLITKNKGSGIKGGIFSQVEMKECIIKNNSADGIVSASNSGTKLSVENSVIDSNTGLGIYTREANGGVYIKGNIIQNNQGGISLNSQVEESHGIIGNNIIRFNNGEGISLNSIYSLDFMVINNLIYNNSGVGIFLTSNSSPLINNTILNNSGAVVTSYLNMFNCIIRNNNSIAGKQIRTDSEEDPKVHGQILNSNIEDFTVSDLDGKFIGNIDIDPQFADFLHNDYHLSDYSPCINAGIADTTGLKLNAGDLDRNVRIFDGRVDMGAFEYQHDNFHILKQPVNSIACEGTSINFETFAIGGIIGYQWQKNGVDIPSANQSILTIYPANSNDDGNYNCLIIADDKTVSTNMVRLTISKNYQISWQTASFIVCPGEDTLLSINTTNGDNLDFKWYKNNQVIAGAVNSELEIISSETAQHDVYYSVVSNNCKSVESKNIDVFTYSMPKLQLPEDTTIAINEPLNIDAGAGFQSYQWNTGSENEILALPGLSSGVYTYSVSVTDQNSCNAEDSIRVTVGTISNIPETADKFGFIIYPNPASAIVYLETDKSVEEEVIISIMDNTGKILLQKKFSSLYNTTIYPLDVSDLVRGVYYLQIRNNQQIKVEQLVIE